jgi:putative membrane protein
MTGTIFGSYHYGETLGFSVADVPLVMGLNWLILIYCTGSMLNHFKLNTILKSISGATILVLLDLLIEQVAIRNDFWHWKNSEIPLQNFIAWWIISFVFLYGFFLVLKNNTNRLSLLYLIVQFGFFGSLVIFTS